VTKPRKATKVSAKLCKAADWCVVAVGQEIGVCGFGEVGQEIGVWVRRREGRGGGGDQVRTLGMLSSVLKAWGWIGRLHSSTLCW
jgi:hypothetical protein